MSMEEGVGISDNTKVLVMFLAGIDITIEHSSIP